MADDFTKRMNYFDGQFLRAEDFQVEQAYHIDRLRRHINLQHTPGVGEGLQVTRATTPNAVTVEVGTAIDAQGREIVVLVPQTIPMPTGEATQVEIYIAYGEVASDPSTDPGISGNTRITERPTFPVRRILPVPAEPVPTYGVLLATVTLDNGQVTAEPDNNVRTPAGIIIGSVATAGDLRFLTGGPTPTEKARILANGNVGIGNATPDHVLVVGPPGGGRHLVVNDIPTARWGLATGDFNLAIQNDGSGTWETRLLITRTGRVGIGTTGPNFALDVVGRIRLRQGTDGTTGLLAVPDHTERRARLHRHDGR